MDSLKNELDALYGVGKNEEILARIAEKYSSLAEMPTSIIIIKGWANYRRKEYADAELAFTMAVERENSPKGWEGLAQIAAYVDKNDGAITLAAEKVPNSSSICNAWAIRARDADSGIEVSKIVRAALGLINAPEIGAINLLNNTARLLIAKPRVSVMKPASEDYLLALGFYQAALAKYGSVNFHHRAGVWYWISVIYEKLNDRQSASDAAFQSLKLWEEQVKFAPDNKSFGEKLDGARKRYEQISSDLSSC